MLQRVAWWDMGASPPIRWKRQLPKAGDLLLETRWTRWDAIQRQGPIGSIPADADDRSMDDVSSGPLIFTADICSWYSRHYDADKCFLDETCAVFQNPAERKNYISVGLTMIVPAGRNAAQFDTL